MTIRIEINTENDAFADGKKPFEVARMLEELAMKIECTGDILEQTLQDVNGLRVGVMIEVNNNE